MKTSIALLTAGLALAAHGALQAQSGRSLGDARSDVIHGNGPGITLIPARPKAAPPGTPASPSTSASAPQGKTAGTAAPAGTWGAPAASTTTSASTSTAAAASPGSDTPSAADRLNNLFRSGEPLSGQPMNAATRNDPPGIVLPTGRDKK